MPCHNLSRMESEIKFSARKPPLHPGLRWSDDRHWIADQLRHEAQNIKSTSKAFVTVVSIEHKLPQEWSYDHECVLDMARFVLTKFRSTPPGKRDQYDSSILPKDRKSPYYFTYAASKIFALMVQSACKVKNAWWTYDFSDDLVRLVKTKLRETAAPSKKKRVRLRPVFGPKKINAAPLKKKRKRLCVCVDYGPMPGDDDAVVLKKLKSSC